MSTRLCKYNCGKSLIWDNGTKSFKEEDNTPHTKERCASLKSLEMQTKPDNGKSDMAKMHDENMVANSLLVAALNRVAAALEARK